MKRTLKQSDLKALGPPTGERRTKRHGIYVHWRSNFAGKKVPYKMAKARYIWCMTKGDIPAGMYIVFLDGNRFNLDIDNLRMMTGSEMGSYINKHFAKNPTNPRKEIDGVEHRFCNKCKTFHPLDNYFKRPENGGYYATCKDCLREYSFHYARKKSKERQDEQL